MANRPREFYKGQRKRISILKIVLFILAFLIVGGGVMFYALQKYVVFNQNGISVEFPILATPSVPTDEGGGAAVGEQVDAELVIENPDYSSVPARAGEGITDMRALVVPAASVNSEGIAAYKALLNTYSANALLLEVKPASGQLVYPSAVSTATDYGLVGVYDLRAAVQELNDAGIYTAALLSCGVDDLLATRNANVALKNAYGSVMTTEKGMWLDPYSTTVRTYISDLTAELADMGFREVVLDNLSLPNTEEQISYTEQMTFSPTPVSGVSGLAMSVTNAAADKDVAVSAILDADTVHADAEGRTGQDAGLFFKVFDRVCCFADSAWQYGFDRDGFESYVTLGDIAQRYLPVMSYAPEEATSWIVNVPDTVFGEKE